MIAWEWPGQAFTSAVLLLMARAKEVGDVANHLGDIHFRPQPLQYANAELIRQTFTFGKAIPNNGNTIYWHWHILALTPSAALLLFR
jgi:hypothetical protein